MLSYQHIYHAGNFADVHKHAVESVLLAQLKQKEAPFCFIDTHAGRGSYDLRAPEAEKTAEYAAGIGMLWRRRDWPESLLAYRRAIETFNAGAALAIYPGSAGLARHLMRPADRLVLMEMHPQEHAFLREFARGDRRIGVHKRDGLQGLYAMVPPKERRGLVLVDPSYEIKAEFTAVPRHVERAARKWPQGIFAIWYPILPGDPHRALVSALGDGGLGRVFVSEIERKARGKSAPPGLRGSGMAIVNPPWQVDETVAAFAPWLADGLFGAERGLHRAGFVDER